MKRLASLALLGSLAAQPVAGQSAEEFSAYRAMIYTTVGALTPLPPSLSPLGARGSRTTLHGRIGHLSREAGLALNTVGLGVEVPASRWRLTGTLAYMAASCGIEWEGDSDCSGDVMLGGTARTTLTSKPLGSRTAPARGQRSTRSGDGTLVVGFEGSAGFSPRQGEQALAVAVGFPVGIALRSGNVRLMPFLTPAVGYGRIGDTSYDEDIAPTSYASHILLIGGGLGLQFGRSGIGATVGFQKALVAGGGATQLGVNMTWQGLTSR